MLKKIRLEILIILILFLSILFSHNTDTVFYNYFPYYNQNFFQEIHLKKFFENITTLGDSMWYFSISILFVVIFFLLKEIKFLDKYKKNISRINYYNLLLFSSILTSGILTQVIKHVVGRPRPNTFNFESEVNFKFLTLDSNFHSFPSGHTSTVFAVFLVISLLVPKLKYFLLFLTTIIAFSRVVVGAHYITDIVGGIAVAFIGFKFSKLIVSKILNINNANYFTINSNFTLVIFFFLLLSVFLAIGPTLDIFISNLFYYEKNQFVIQAYHYVSLFFRKIVLSFILIYILVLPIFSFLAPIKQIYYDYYFKIKDIFYIWSLTILSLVVFINLIFKNMWGRARPNDILELGGTNLFSPWYQISKQCSLNCSFVSGDAAVGFSLIVFYFLIKKEIYLWLALFFGLVIGTIRIMEGGHFFSDVIFSCLFVFLLNFFIYSYYSKKTNG